VNFVIRAWTQTADYWDVYWYLMRTVKMRFDDEGISIPFPQRDVHVYTETVAALDKPAAETGAAPGPVKSRSQISDADD
jgi:small-conductance mechanosensitive channel